ncbi:MAG: hypothetical protein QXD77_00345 [Candidatus Aenigmatarchaeota archaeon]
MQRGLLLTALFVILLFTLYTPSVAYTEGSNNQEGLLSGIISTINKVVTTVTNVVKTVVTTVGNIVSPPKPPSSPSSPPPTMTTTTAPKTQTTDTGKYTNTGTKDTGSKDTSGKDTGNKDTGTNTGSGSSGGGEGGSGGLFSGITNWFTSLLNPPKTGTVLTATDVDFSGATPFDGKTGAQEKKNNPLTAAVAGGLSALAGWGLGIYQAAKDYSPLFNSVASAYEGAGKALVMNAKSAAEFWGSVGSDVVNGNFSGAVGKIGAAANDAYNGLAKIVDEHKSEIIMAAAVAAAAAFTIVTLGTGSPVSIAIIAGAAAYTGYYVATTYPPLLQNVDKACGWGNCSDGGQAMKELNGTLATDGVITLAGLAGGAAGGAAGGVVKVVRMPTLATDVGNFKLSPHASQQMAWRGVSEGQLRGTLENNIPFQYMHDGSVKFGYYDHGSGVFVPTKKTLGGNVILTAFKPRPKYVNNLKSGK